MSLLRDNSAQHWKMTASALSPMSDLSAIQTVRGQNRGKLGVNRNTKNLVAINCGLSILLAIFIWSVFSEVQIDMNSVGVVAFGLVFFPVLFVLTNIGALNRRYPLTPKPHAGDLSQRDQSETNDSA